MNPLCLCVAVYCFFTCGVCQGQTGKVDGAILLQAKKLWHQNPDSALGLSQQYLQTAIQHNDEVEMAKAWNSIGVCQLFLSDYFSARVSFEKALYAFRKTGTIKGVADAENNIALVYESVGLDSLALVRHKKSLELRRQRNDSSGVAASYSNIGVLLTQRGKHKEARQMFLNAFLIDSLLMDTFGISYDYHNLGLTYLRELEFDSSINFFHRSIELKQLHGDFKGLMESWLNMGFLSLGQNNLRQASYYNNLADSINRARFNDKLVDAQVKQLRAGISESLGNATQVLRWLQQSEQSKDSVQNPEIIRKILAVENGQNKLHSNTALRNFSNVDFQSSIIAWLPVLMMAAFVAIFIAAALYRDKRRRTLKSLIFHNSHKTRGPLSSIRGLLYILEMDPSAKENKDEYIEKIKQKADELDEATKEMTRKLNNEL